MYLFLTAYLLLAIPSAAAVLRQKQTPVVAIAWLLAIVLSSPEMAGRSEREVYQRITALGSMCMSVCYSSILEGKPDNIDAMKPVLYDIIRRALSPEK